MKETRGDPLQFFTDGHKVLNETILKWFIWYKNIGLILDWFHLEKKCKKQLSLAMKGRVVRNQILDKLMPLLWYGLTDNAISFLIVSSRQKHNGISWVKGASVFPIAQVAKL
ncbi:MAG: hypothetical protein LWW97_09130 [Deltaproteobacteria bacterium]|nr:hypothetical protein [Deltaproteobacteria bacterium]